MFKRHKYHKVHGSIDANGKIRGFGMSGKWWELAAIIGMVLVTMFIAASEYFEWGM